MTDRPPPVSRRLDYILQALEDFDSSVHQIRGLLERALASRPAEQDPQTKLLLTFREAGEMLSISERSLRSMVQLGNLPSVRLGSRSLRILRTDVDEYIHRNRRDWGSSRWKGHGGRRSPYERSDMARRPEERLQPLAPELRNKGLLFNTLQALRRARITTPSQIRAMTDEELLFIKGIGRTGLASIRRHFPHG